MHFQIGAAVGHKQGQAHKAEQAVRDCEVHRDDGDGVAGEDIVIASLNTTRGDADSHKGEIDTLCSRFGLSREVLPSP